MPICITCSHPVKNLYTTYSKADDRSLGKGVRLTQCPNCKRFADKYVEHDYVVLFIDLVLIKPQVYRHLLFNRLQPSTPKDSKTKTKTKPQSLDPSILRLGILLILFDVYITWARIERVNTPNQTTTSPATSTSPNTRSPLYNGSNGSNFSNAPIITQYLFFLTLNVVATLVQHGVIRGLARVLLKPGRGPSQPGEPTGETVDVDNSDQRSHARSGSSPSKLGRHSSNPSTSRSQMAAQQSTGTANGTSASTTALDEHTPRASLSAQPHTRTHQSPTWPTTTTALPFDNTSPSPDTVSAAAASAPGSRATPSAISTALLVSSCTKLFPILLVIWPTSSSTSASTPTPLPHRATSYIGWVVLVNNIEALLILLECGYVVATALAVAGLVARWVVEGWLLGCVGLVREMEGPVGDVLALVVGRGL